MRLGRQLSLWYAKEGGARGRRLMSCSLAQPPARAALWEQPPLSATVADKRARVGHMTIRTVAFGGTTRAGPALTVSRPIGPEGMGGAISQSALGRGGLRSCCCGASSLLSRKTRSTEARPFNSSAARIALSPQRIAPKGSISSRVADFVAQIAAPAMSNHRPA